MPFVQEHGDKGSIFEARDVDDLRQAARLCHDNDIPIVMRGEGSGYTGGAYNFGSGLVVDTTKMNRVLDVDSSKGLITVEAGISIDDAREVALGLGWDLKQYPTGKIGHTATIGGFLQTTTRGIGSLQHGSTLDFGNIVSMRVVPISKDADAVTLDGVLDHEQVIGSLRSLGTSAIISEITLALAPSQYWVDMAVSFSSTKKAFEFALKSQSMNSVTTREFAVFPSSMLTTTLNHGERKHHLHFMRNTIPEASHTSDHVPLKEETEDLMTMPTSAKETEDVVILSVNEASLPFLNHVVRQSGGHTIYLEHARGGFGWLESTTWQQACTRLSRYYSDALYCHYEMDLGPIDPSCIDRSIHQMQQVDGVIRDSVREQLKLKQWASVDSPFVDECMLLQDNILHRPAWFTEFTKRSDGKLGLVGFTNFRIQQKNFDQLSDRLSRICSGLKQLQSKGVIESFVNPHAYTTQDVFMDTSADLHRLQETTKARFDPKRLLNPRTF